jgi:hypothetical protein
MTGQKNALAVREAIEAGHPEITIKSPLTSLSGNWELAIDGDNTSFDDFWMLVDHLAARYDNDNEPDDDETGDAPPDRYVEIAVLPGREQPTG